MKNQYRILGAITLILAIAFMAGCPQEASSSKDNYGIELKQGASALTSYTFTNRAPLTVTVANIGTAATGPLTIVIDGTGSAAFAVSPESLGSIAKDGSDTFTVAPTGTLTPGPYSATVTVSGAKGITASFDVDYEEPEEPAYGIALMAAGEALESYTFTGLDSLDVTVVNSGTAATGALTIEISGDDLDAFVLSETEITDIAVSASAAFTVEPASELDAGSYSATITVSGDNGIEASFTVFYENILVVADVLDGLWWNEDLIQGTFSGLIPEGTPGVYVFDNLNYWSLNSWGFAYKGTFTVSGENSGNFTLNQTEKKDESTDWGFAEASDTQTGTWTLSNSGNTLTIKISVITITLTRADWHDAENNTDNNGPWQDKIDDSALDAIIPPPPSIVTDAFDGLWYSEDTYENTPDGKYGVWVFDNGIFWSLNGWGYARKGTFTTTSATSGIYQFTLTRQKNNSTGWAWADTTGSSPGTWTLSNGGNTLTFDGIEFTKVDWWGPENGSNAVSSTRWETRIGESALTAIVPPPPEPVYDSEIDISDFFGSAIIGTYSTTVTPTSISLISSTSASFSSEMSHPLSGGTINIDKSTLPPNSIVYLKVVAMVGGAAHESRTVSVHTGQALQVHDFMSVDSVLSSTSTTWATVSVDSGVLAIDFAAANNYGGYGRIFLSNVLDSNSKSISDIKAVYYKYRSTVDINEMTTYVREDSNPRRIVVGSVKGVGAEDTWTDMLAPSAEQALTDGPDFSGLNNGASNRRFSIGINNTAAATVYVKDLYFFFDEEVPVYGWVDDEFILPPILAQPTDDLGDFLLNNKAATRDLLASFDGTAVPVAHTSAGNTPDPAMLHINSNNFQVPLTGPSVGSNELPASLLWSAKYLVLKMGTTTGVDATHPAGTRQIRSGLYLADRATLTGWPTDEVIWSNSSSLSANGGGDPYTIYEANGTENEDKGFKVDVANKLIVIELAKAIPFYDSAKSNPSFNNQNVRFTFQYTGGSSQNFITGALDLQAIYLVNILE